MQKKLCSKMSKANTWHIQSNTTCQHMNIMYYSKTHRRSCSTCLRRVLHRCLWRCKVFCSNFHYFQFYVVEIQESWCSAFRYIKKNESVSYVVLIRFDKISFIFMLHAKKYIGDYGIQWKKFGQIYESLPMPFWVYISRVGIISVWHINQWRWEIL